MFIYTTCMTMGLTWLILIQPNHYTARSNAIDWLLTMCVFVFLPMLLSYCDAYMTKLDEKRKAGSRGRVHTTHMQAAAHNGRSANSLSYEPASRKGNAHTQSRRRAAVHVRPGRHTHHTQNRRAA